MGDSTIPDTAPVFDEPSRRAYGSFCIHASYTVNGEQRRVTCNACKAQLDPFEIILQWANRQRVRENLDDDIREKRKALEQLYGEEKRTKARLRNAKKKDAEAAVAKALAKQEEDHERTVFGLLGARAAITDALKRLGHADDEDEDGESWKRGARG